MLWPICVPKSRFFDFISFVGVDSKYIKALFLALKGLLSVYFQLQRFINDPENHVILAVLTSHFNIVELKKVVLDLLKLFMAFCKKCLGIVFSLKRPTCISLFSASKMINQPGK